MVLRKFLLGAVLRRGRAGVWRATTAPATAKASPAPPPTWRPAMRRANGRARRATMPTPATARSTQINKQNVAGCASPGASATGRCTAMKARRWWWATPCIWSRPIPTSPMRWTCPSRARRSNGCIQPNPDPRSIGKACCDKVLRGWAYADGKLIYNLLDDHTVAVDAKTGKEVWRTLLDDVDQGPDHDPGRLRGGQQGLCRFQRRRDGHQRLVRGAGCEGRPCRLEGADQRSRCRRPDRPGFQALLSLDAGQGSGRDSPGRRGVEAGRVARPGAGCPTIPT